MGHLCDYRILLLQIVYNFIIKLLIACFNRIFLAGYILIVLLIGIHKRNQWVILMYCPKSVTLSIIIRNERFGSEMLQGPLPQSLVHWWVTLVVVGSGIAGRW